jgi:diguanylate cyclase (GGDEF)-like protein
VLERVRQIEDLDLAAVTDPLTGIGNRRAFERRLAELDPDTALVMCDLNRFKELNDTLGHAAGDQVLRIFAAAAAMSIRAGDLVARIGGDEFALLVNGGEPAARAVLDRLRSAWEEPDGVGFSAGLAAHRPGETGEQLSERADQQLYAAKRAGRAAREQRTPS